MKWSWKMIFIAQIWEYYLVSGCCELCETVCIVFWYFWFWNYCNDDKDKNDKLSFSEMPTWWRWWGFSFYGYAWTLEKKRVSGLNFFCIVILNWILFLRRYERKIISERKLWLVCWLGWRCYFQEEWNLSLKKACFCTFPYLRLLIYENVTLPYLK